MKTEKRGQKVKRIQEHSMTIPEIQSKELKI